MAIGIHCCKDCVPPKRYPGCGAKCEEYIKEKAQLEEDKKKIKADKERFPNMTLYDFDANAFSRPSSRRKRR